MIRAVLAAILAVALLGATMPALSDARTTNAHERIELQHDTIERAAHELATGSVPVREGDLAARRVVTIDVPGRSLVTAGVELLGIGCPRAVLGTEPIADCEPALVYRVDGGDPTVHRFPDVPLATPDGPVVLDSGSHEVTLRYVLVESDGSTEPVVQLLRG